MDADSPDIPQRQCSKCKTFFPATTRYFHSDKRRKYGVCHICKTCRGCINHEAWYTKHPRQVIPDGYKKCTKCKRLFPSNTDYFCLWKHGSDGMRKQCKECDAEYRKAHVKEKSIYWAGYFASNAERIHQYQHGHTEERRVRKHKRRALEQSTQGTHTAQDIREQYKRQKGSCYYCSAKFGKGKSAYHIDHIVPISRGGSNDPSNLVLACPACNLSKGTKLLHEWVEGGRLL